MPGLLRAAELDRPRIDGLIHSAREFARGTAAGDRLGAVVGLLFFEDSLRTRVGFEAAAVRIGAGTTTVTSLRQTTQMAIPETLEDAARCVAPYCDVICLRHPDVDAPDRISRLITTPLLNCGNGDDEHPTQALVDLLAIDELRGGIDGLRVAIVGDLLHMRVAHSLLLALSRYEAITVRCISPQALAMPERYARVFHAAGGTLQAAQALELDDIDIVYVAGLPRTPQNNVTIADQDRYRIESATVQRLAAHVRILCPLPRVDEIATTVDSTPQAAYFQQSALGLGMRMALLKQALA